jgi:hypothetical protein
MTNIRRSAAGSTALRRFAAYKDTDHAEILAHRDSQRPVRAILLTISRQGQWMTVAASMALSRAVSLAMSPLGERRTCGEEPK